MQLGLCLDPATLATLPTTHGLDFIEGHVQNFLLPHASAAEFAPHAAALRACPLTMPAANCFLPAHLKVTGPVVDSTTLAAHADIAFRRAREVGMSLIVFGSAGARMMPDGWSAARGFEQYVEALRLFAPLAQAQGVTLVVEPLNRVECNLVNTIVEGAEAVRRAEHPSVKLLVDLFHMLRNGESPDDILRVGPIHHAHLAEDRNRAAPGVNGDDFRPFLRALKKTGYNNRLTIECIWKSGPALEAAPALQALRTQLTDAGY
ncbi:MAG: sugar phosphate isomerase/epimerase [Undibacterium sp.]|nr:sugar phosphate isomerase/epimerase [Opitutaceae bacterium]